MVTRALPGIAAIIWLATSPAVVIGQTGPEPPPSAVSGPPPPDDTAFVAAEPDFTLTALPTALRLPDGKWAFRVAHRFTRALAQGSFQDLASDLFGLDGSALVGLEVRYGVRPGTQLVVLRTSDRTIQMLAQQSIVTAGTRAIGVDAVAAVQGLDNFSESYTSTLGVILSHRFGTRGTAYLQPLLVLNPLPESDTADDFTILAAVGARVRFGASTYLVGEFAPRVAGASDGDHHAAFALEKRRGGHSFQLSVANSFATTLGRPPADMARRRTGALASPSRASSIARRRRPAASAPARSRRAPQPRPRRPAP
jgi:hypothetical protein